MTIDPKKQITVKLNEFDTRTSSDLANAKFCGLRANDLANRFEIWILGQIDRTVSYQQFFEDETSLTTAYCIAFGLRDAILTGDIEQTITEMKNRKRAIEQLDKSNPRLLDAEHKRLTH